MRKNYVTSFVLDCKIIATVTLYEVRLILLLMEFLEILTGKWYKIKMKINKALQTIVSLISQATMLSAIVR